MRDLLRRMQLFMSPDGGGSAGGGDGGAGAAAGAEAAGVNNQADAAPVIRAKKTGPKNPLADVQYGRQAEAGPAQEAAAPAEGTPEETEAPAADPQAEWQEIRNGRYKAQFDADVQAIVKDRLKNSKQAEARLQSLEPLLGALAQKYGLENGDLDGLTERLRDDDSLYEDEAMRRGIDVQTLKEIKQLEQENQQYKQQQEQSQQEILFQQHIQKLVQQSEAVKQMFPGFDLRTELQNDTFRRLTSPEGGIDVMTAYRVVHAREIEPQAMQVASQRTAQMISNKIAAGQRRPSENGLNPSAGIETRSDPSKLKKADFEEIKRRVSRGERIEF